MTFLKKIIDFCFVYKNPYFCPPFADVAKLADALDLGSSAARHVGSTPIIRTKEARFYTGFFLLSSYPNSLLYLGVAYL